MPRYQSKLSEKRNSLSLSQTRVPRVSWVLATLPTYQGPRAVSDDISTKSVLQCFSDSNRPTAACQRYKQKDKQITHLYRTTITCTYFNKREYCS